MTRVEAALDSVEDPRRIVALTIDPQTLRQIRRKRMEFLGVLKDESSKASTYISGIGNEVTEAKKWYALRGYPVVGPGRHRSPLHSMPGNSGVTCCDRYIMPTIIQLCIILQPTYATANGPISLPLRVENCDG